MASGVIAAALGATAVAVRDDDNNISMGGGGNAELFIVAICLSYYYFIQRKQAKSSKWPGSGQEVTSRKSSGSPVSIVTGLIVLFPGIFCHP